MNVYSRESLFGEAVVDPNLSQTREVWTISVGWDRIWGWGGDPYGSPFGDDFDSNPFGFDDDTDPREIARWTRQMSAQMGEPLDADLDLALSDLERGADPEEVIERLEESDPPPLDE